MRARRPRVGEDVAGLVAEVGDRVAGADRGAIATAQGIGDAGLEHRGGGLGDDGRHELTRERELVDVVGGERGGPRVTIDQVPASDDCTARASWTTPPATVQPWACQLETVPATWSGS